jgi:hypothetical protein
MSQHLARGEHETAITIGHRILGVDSDADAIELLLLRAYSTAVGEQPQPSSTGTTRHSSAILALSHLGSTRSSGVGSGWWA